MGSAYNHTLCNTLTDVATAIYAGLAASGWTLHDDISTTSKVYSSNGESGQERTSYVHVYVGPYLYLKPYAYWDTATHTGYKTHYRNTTYIFSEGVGVVYVGGDKNFFHVYKTREDVVGAGSRYLGGAFGFIVPLDSTHTLTSAAAASGATTLSVVNAGAFKRNVTYQIISPNHTEGVNKIYVEDVDTAANTLTIHPLAAAMASGSWLGAYAFGSGYNNNQFYTVTDGYSTGTADAAYDTLFSNPFANGQHDPNGFSGEVLLQTPISSTDHYSAASLMPALDSNIQGYAASLSPVGHVFCVSANNDIRVSQCTSGTISTVTDTAMSWSTDEHKDKCMVVYSGKRLLDIRKISGNTSDTLTFYHNLSEAMDTTSLFYISDSVYVHSCPKSPTYTQPWLY